MSKEQRYTLKLIIIGIAVFFAVASVPVLISPKTDSNVKQDCL